MITPEKAAWVEWNQRWDGFGGVAFTYDYDDENRLTFMEYDDFGTPYYQLNQAVYDGVGRLREMAEYIYDGSEWNLTDAKEYIYDGWRVIQERDGNNNPTVSYTRGKDLSGTLEGAGGIGGLLARSSGYSSGNWTSDAYYHADALGNITCLLDANQTRVAYYRYNDPFGFSVTASGSLAAPNTYRFSNKYQDDETDMLYYGYRYYHFQIGRWISRDPIWQTASSSFPSEKREINVYEFAVNNPPSAVDKLGLITFSGCLQQQENDITQGFQNICDNLKTRQFACCLNNGSASSRLRDRCNTGNLNVVCEQRDTYWNQCAKRCGFSYVGFGNTTIHLCLDGINGNGCPDVGCTVAHEMTHITGIFGEYWPQKTEVCAGCPSAFTPLFPNGIPPADADRMAHCCSTCR